MYMRLKKFQVDDYKSIKSFDPCWLAADITIFAGKNESGKTAALQALSDFDPKTKSLREDAVPLEDESLEPALQLWFDIPKTLRSQIFEGTGIVLNKDCNDYLDKHGFPIVKEFEGEFSIGPEFEDILDDSTEVDTLQAFKMAKDCVAVLSSLDERFANIESIKDGTNFADLKNKISAIVTAPKPKAPDGQPQSEQEVKPFDEETQAILQNLNTALDFLIETRDYDTVLERVYKYMPRFVFFDSFEHDLPYEVSLGEVENHPAILDFLKVADIDIEQVRATTDEQKRRNLLSGKSAVISGDFKGFWQQDKIKLKARVSDGKFIFEIEEDDKTYAFKPEQRSKGFQWFLSFYLRLKAENILGTEQHAVLLIDEPGLYLHATAQQDVLSVLESLANDGAQVIFSTHSPYLLDTARFDRIKLVTKDLSHVGTVVHNKMHKNADRDTLTPIVTALGHDIARDSSLVRDRNVLLEGMSDYYFITAMAEYLGVLRTISDVSLMPCKGASQIHLVASILFGWGLNFIAVLDNDKEGKAAAKGLREGLDMPEEQIIVVSEDTNATIEDLFSREDFLEHVLSVDVKEAADEEKPNSKYVKVNMDKVLLAKSFLDKVRKDGKSMKLSKTTQDNFMELLTNIPQAFEVKNKDNQGSQKAANER